MHDPFTKQTFSAQTATDIDFTYWKIGFSGRSFKHLRVLYLVETHIVYAT